MISKLLEKRGTRFYSIIIFGLFILCGSASAQVVSLTPTSQVDACNDVDTLWIHLDANITGVEAAAIVIGYDYSYVSVDGYVDTALSSAFVGLDDYPADDSVVINVGILTGDFDGATGDAGNFVGLILSADAEVSSTSISFIRTDLRDSDNLPISHSTSSAATIQIDCTQPVVTCPTDITQGNDAGNCSAVVTFTPTATDNFTASPSIVANPVSGSTFAVGTTPVEVIATDDAGNADTCSFNVTVNDTENPTISCPVNQTGNVDGSCNFSIPDYTGLAIGVNDNCTVSPTVTQSPIAGTVISGHGTVQVITLTADDGNGNTTPCTFNLTLNDNILPTLTCVGNQIKNVDAGQCDYTAILTEFDLTASADNCGITSTTYELSGATTIAETVGTSLVGIDFNTGVTTVTWRVYDAAANTDNCTFTVTVSDNEDPTISCITPPTRSADAGQCYYTVVGTEFDPTATGDNCGITSVLNDFNAGASLAGAQIPDGQLITWTITDNSTNTATCNYTVTVNDTQLPTLTCVGNQAKNVDAGQCDYTAILTEFDLTASADNCGITSTTYELSGATTIAETVGTSLVGIDFNTGVTTVTWRVYDAATNTDNCTFTVTVTDNILPTLTCVGNQAKNVDAGQCDYTAILTEFDLTASADNCGITSTTYELSGATTIAETVGTSLVGIAFNTGVTTVTWRVYDAATNTDNCTFTVTVSDNEDPTISCITPPTRSADAGQCYYTVVGTEFDPTATGDNCGITSVLNDFNAGASLAGAQIPDGQLITWTITDNSTNTATCNYTVTVNDTQLPTLTCVGNQAKNVDAGQCDYTAILTEFDLTASADNCGITSTTYELSGATTIAETVGTSLVGIDFNTGVTTVTWRVYDAATNTDNCTFTVTVSDNEDPTISCITPPTRSADAGQCYYTVVGTEFDPTATGDNCGITSVLNDFNAGASLAGAQIPDGQLITWTITDNSTNTATCNYTVTVNDTQLPTLTCVGNQAKNVDAGQCDYTAILTEFDLTASADNCGITSTTYELSGATTIAETVGTSLVGIDFNTGVTTVTWRVYDAATNTDNCTFTVTVSDNEDPTISCITPPTRSADAGQCYYTVVGTEFDPTATGDNCGITSVLNDFNAGASLAGAQIPDGQLITWTITDNSANTATCGFMVTVTDNENPVVTCPADVPAAGCAQTNPVFTGTATAIDNCDPSPVITYADVQVDNVITRTWTATDASTNSDNCQQIITINDYSAPTMQTVAEAEGGYYNTAPVFSTFGFDDDCDLNDGFYQIDGFGAGSWTSLFTDVSGTTWNDNGWTLPGFGVLAEGTHTVYFMADDDVNNVSGDGGEISWQFFKDTGPPAAATTFTVEAGHEKCKLSWTNPTGDASFVGVEIRRNPWGVGAYPEYDDDGAAIGYPADETEGDLVYQGPAEIYRDTNNTTTMPRNVYYYSIFSYDLAGNYSTATSAQQGLATNYWLGDVSGNGNVYFEDLTSFSLAYGSIEFGTGYDNEWDIGPTVSGSPKGIPTTDNEIQFEDLVIFAINYNAVNSDMKIAPIFADEKVSGPLSLSLDLPSGELKVGEEFPVRVILRNNPGTVKGIHLVIPYDPDRLELVGVTKGHQLEDAPYPVFFDGRDADGNVDVSLALLGGKAAIGGSGEISTLTFRLLKAGNMSFGFDLIDLRDSENHKLLTEEYTGGYELVAGIPTHYELGRNIPNPFNPITQIAYQLPKAGEVSLKIYNIRGQVVRTLVDEFMPAGSHEVVWNGRSNAGHEVASGIYLYRMKSGDFSAARKMVLLK